MVDLKSTNKAIRIALFGQPGAGKGTQAVRLAEKLNIPHISTGDMFRRIQEENSALADEVRSILSSGALVPDDLVTKLTLARLSENDCRDGFILDGFPRTIAQAKALQGSKFELSALFCIEVDRTEIVRRLAGRRVCGSCASVYHIDHLPTDVGTCPKDGSQLIQRDDDKPEAVAIRLDIFNKNFLPLVDYFGSLGLIRKINGSGSADEVFERIIGEIEFGFR